MGPKHSIANKMIETSSFAAKRLKVSFFGDCTSSLASLVDAAVFSEMCNKSRTLVISHLSKENELRKPSPSKANVSSKLARLAKL